MIIDASVAVKWSTPEEDSDLAASISGRDDLFAPYLLMAEVANALCKKGRRRELAAEVVPLQLADLQQILDMVDESEHVGRAAEIALELGHSAYDCIYLTLAEARGDKLVTADRKFIERVRGGSFEPLVLTLTEAVRRT